jgi:hypothetical protein
MKKNQNRLTKLFITAAFCIAATQVFSQAAPLHMNEAIKIAIANNNALKADSMNIGCHRLPEQGTKSRPPAAGELFRQNRV